MKTHAVSIIAGGLLALVGCGHSAEPVAASFEGEGWIDTSPPSPPSDRPGFGGDEEGEDDEDDEDDEDEEESGAYWALFGLYANGELGELEGEFFAIDRGQEVCLLLFGTTVRGPADGCTECMAAWEIEFGRLAEEINVDGACQTYGPEQIEGLVLKLGITAGNLLMQDEGEGWRPIGEAEVEEGEIFVEWEHGGEPFEPE